MRFVLTWGHGQPPDLNLDSYFEFYDKDQKSQCILYPNGYEDINCWRWPSYGRLVVHQTNVSSIVTFIIKTFL